MGNLLAWSLILGFAAIVVHSAIVLNRAMQVQLVKSSRVAPSDITSTKRRFIEFLREANRSIIVYDDEDRVQDSIYDDQEVLDSIRRKLNSVPGFSLRCLFNVDEPKLLIRREAKDSRLPVEIRIKHPDRPRCRVHYKIIDGGTKAYLSRHESGKTQRRYRIVDCTGVPKKHQKHVSDETLGLFNEHFQKAFSAGATT